MIVRRDDWLSGVMAIDAFRVDVTGGADAAALAAALPAGPASFCYAKIDTLDVVAARMLGAAGFYVAETNMTFDAAPADVVRACGAADDRRIDPVDARSAGAVLEIAETCFRYNRFHLDPAVRRETANRIKREWIQSYIAGVRGDRLFVAFEGAEPSGFLAALVSDAGGQCVATIDLVGVATALQRRGVGRALVGAFARHYADLDRLRVGTQAANLASMQLYERAGFTIWRSGYVMHRHTGAAPI